MSRRALLLSIGASLLLLAVVFIMMSSEKERSSPERGSQAPASPPGEQPAVPDAPRSPDAPPAAAPGITGRVVNRDGKPVSGAEVTEFDLSVVSEPEGDPPVGRATITDEEGRFSLAVEGTGAHTLTARHPEHGTGTLPLVRVPKEGGVEVEIRLEHAAILGKVVAGDGSPIAGARISTDSGAPLRTFYRCLAGWWYRPITEVSTTTNEDGTFQLAPLLPGTFDLIVEAKGCTKLGVGSVPAPSDGLVVRLDPGGAVTGVVRIIGEPLPDELKLRAYGPERTIPVEGTDTPFRLPGLPPGDHELIVWAAGCTEYTASVTVGPGRDSDPVLVELHPGMRVSGLVVEKETGKPVPGAEVAAWRPWKAIGGYSWSREIVTHADEGGRYECRLRAGRWGVAAEKAGFFPHKYDEVVIEVGSEPMEKNLLLAPIPASITGLVRFADGTPVPGATVEIISVGSNPDRDDSGSTSMSGDMQTETGPDGRFRLEEDIVPWSIYGLVATGPGQATAVLMDIRFPKGVREREVEFELERTEETGGRVEGRVVDEEGQPVSGVLVVCARRAILTDSDGRFSRDEVPAGTYRPTYGRVGFAQGFAEAFEIREKQTVRLPDFVLKRSGVLVRGTVRDRRDRPIQGASITAWFHPPGGGFLTLNAQTREDGSYVLAGPDVAGTPLTVQVWERACRHQEKRTTAESEVVVDFTMDRYAVMVGSITFDGPLPEEVQVFTNGHERFKFLDVELDRATGAFRVERVEPGLHRISFRAKGYAPNAYREIEAPDGGEVNVGAVRLTKGGTFEGRVLNADGLPIGGVQVSVQNEFLFTDTDADGRYRLTGLPPGKLTLWVNGLKDREESPSFEAVVKEGKTVTLDLRIPR